MHSLTGINSACQNQVLFMPIKLFLASVTLLFEELMR